MPIDSIFLYNNFRTLPKFDSQGNVITDADGNINSATEGLISGVSDFIGESLLGKKSDLIKFAFSTTLSEILTISLKISYTDAGDISEIEVINGTTVLGKIGDQLIKDLPGIVGTPLLTQALMGGVAGAFGGGFLGTLLGTVAVTGAVTVGFSLLEGFTTSLVEDIVNNNLGLSQIDMQFTDASGVHNSGLFFKDGMGGLSDKGAVAYFLANAGDVNVEGGKFNFSVSGALDREYDIYDLSIYQTVADNLGITIEEFLSAGYNGKTNADGFIGGAAYTGIFSSESPVLIYVPVKVNGVTETILVNGIYAGSLHNDNLSVGRPTEAPIGNALIVNEGGNTHLVIRKYNSDVTAEHDYVIIGTDGSNQITAEDGNDLIVTGAGSDKISAGYGRNTIDGGEGVDTVDYSFVGFGSRGLDINLSNNSASNGLLNFNQVNDTLYNIESIK